MLYQLSDDPQKIRVLLVDDNVDLTRLYRLTMGIESDMCCVGTLSSTKTLTESVASLLPDVVLMDLVIPGEDVLDAVTRLRATNPSLQILILSGYEAPSAVVDAERAGASGYISKNHEPEEVLARVREFHRQKDRQAIQGRSRC